MKKIETISELIEDLSEVYSLVRAHKISLEEAKEVANLGGKLVRASTAQLAYNMYMDNGRKIAFLEGQNSITNGISKKKLKIATAN